MEFFKTKGSNIIFFTVISLKDEIKTFFLKIFLKTIEEKLDPSSNQIQNYYFKILTQL